MRLLAIFLLSGLLTFVTAAQRPLDIYVIDVEGGKAMLVVAPSGESMLVDAGWPARFATPASRDIDRILAAMQAAGVKQIDNLLITHLDIDHLGDVAALTAKVKVGRIIDNGPLQSTGKGVEQAYAAYAKIRDTYTHLVPKPGDKLPIKGLDVQVVTAATKWIDKPLAGGGKPNQACAATEAKPEILGDHEDNMSIGLLYTLGKFRLLDLADFEWAYEVKLMCPNNPIGTVDVYISDVHAQAKGGAPALVHGVRPQVAIVDNGARKGGDAPALDIIRKSPGLADMWQVHASLAAKDLNAPDDFIANLEEKCEGKWIKLSARTDGTFTVTNGRNGFSKTYKPKR
jgi:beta-lactamase superfamily II metal-dependent hydrolase